MCCLLESCVLCITSIRPNHRSRTPCVYVNKVTSDTDTSKTHCQSFSYYRVPLGRVSYFYVCRYALRVSSRYVFLCFYRMLDGSKAASDNKRKTTPTPKFIYHFHELRFHVVFTCVLTVELVYCKVFQDALVLKYSKKRVDWPSASSINEFAFNSTTLWIARINCCASNPSDINLDRTSASIFGDLLLKCTYR